MYIRTKDNLYEITNKQYDILCGNLTEEEKENYKNITSFGLGSIEEGSYESVLIKDILEYSENLQELCDEFVLKWNKEQFPYSTARQYERYVGYGDLKREIRAYKIDDNKILNKDYVVYGGIWTDEGFIYKAKMNGKGALELK